ncbi:MAG TPA: VanZ family protein [Planctomycetota bacterium]|nr:VanZ family protein [Planctomycetota bacterium]
MQISRLQTRPLWAVLYLLLLLIGTTTAFQLRSEPYPFSHRPFADDVLINIVAFVPLGLLLRRWPLIAVVALATAFSGGIEWGQQWLYRSPSTPDIVTNVIGTVLGARWKGLEAQVMALLTKYRSRIKVLLWAAPILGLLVSWYQVAHRRSVSFDDWEPMPLTIGNEHEDSRPFEGAIKNLLILDLVTTPEELEQQRAGAAGPDPIFSMNVVASTIQFRGSALDAPFAISAADLPAGFEVQDDRLVCRGGRWTLPDEVARAVHDALLGGNSLSIAATVDPVASPGRKQGRIITLSNGSLERCFTLGHTDGRIVFRVRTPASGHNAVMPQLVSAKPWLQVGEQQILCTYTSEWMRAYVGRECVESLLIPTMIRPNVTGRGLPLLLAVCCASASLAAAAYVVRGPQRTFLQILAALILLGLFFLLDIARHFPPLPWHLYLPATLAILTTIALGAARDDADPLLGGSPTSP